MMLLADRFDKLSKPSESLGENGDDPSSVTLKDEWASILECIHNCTDQDDLVVQALKELGTQ